ncbi:MAG: peptide-methionine (S)-S-oxide reductase MsrA [Gammaproteobacteria bacterium]
MMFGRRKAMNLPAPHEALPGRAATMPVPERHFVLGTPLVGPFPAGCEVAYFGLGCFWGAEKRFWNTPGVYTTAVGYAGGITPNPTYHEVCTGMTGHNEVVMVVFDTAKTDFGSLLKVFWESHDPTQGMRQGNDLGTQYRSGVYCTSQAQAQHAQASLERYQSALAGAGYGPITTEVLAAPAFYYAEEYHQQYLAKNPDGYCGLGGTGVRCSN